MGMTYEQFRQSMGAAYFEGNNEPTAAVSESRKGFKKTKEDHRGRRIRLHNGLNTECTILSHSFDKDYGCERYRISQTVRGNPAVKFTKDRFRPATQPKPDTVSETQFDFID